MTTEEIQALAKESTWSFDNINTLVINHDFDINNKTHACWWIHYKEHVSFEGFLHEIKSKKEILDMKPLLVEFKSHTKPKRRYRGGNKKIYF